jgi:hypothetical protein
MAALRADSLRELGWSVAIRLLLGSTLVGLVASAAGGGLYWLWLKREQRRGGS